MVGKSFSQLIADFQQAIANMNLVLKGGDTQTVTIDGVVKPSISKDIKDQYDIIRTMIIGRAAYKTKVSLPATPPADVVLAEVWNDPVKENNGLYGWDNNQWIKSSYDISLQSIEDDLAILKLGAHSTTGEVDYSNMFKAGFYINKSDGVERIYKSWAVTHYIPVSARTVISRIDDSPVTNSSDAACLAFYDENRDYLGHYNSEQSQFDILVGDVFVNARFVRASNAATANVTFKLTGLIATESVEGLSVVSKGLDDVTLPPASMADLFEGEQTTAGYIAVADGAFVSAETWVTSGFYPSKPGAKFDFMGFRADLVSPLSLYDQNKTYLGSVGQRSGGDFEIITVPNSMPVAFVRASTATTSDNYCYPQELGPRQIDPAALEGYTALRSLMNRLFRYKEFFNFFSQGLSGYYLSSTGEFVAANNWICTELIAVNKGDTFTYLSFGSGSVAEVAAYDKYGNYLSQIYDQDITTTPHTITITDEQICFVAASARNLPGDNPQFVGLLLEDGRQGGPAALPVSVFDPQTVYATVNDPLYLYARSLCPPQGYQLAWNLSESNEELAKVNYTAPGQHPIKLTLRDGDDRVEVLNFNVRCSREPISPATMQNFVCIGDSLTLGMSRANVSGAYPNELSRRLTGVGTELLTGDNSPSPKSLGNIRFLGSIGDQPVKHEGRGGWKAYDYLNNDNALRNPISGEMDFNYWAENNGFDAGSVAGGVLPDGSNLTAIILLGWNDVYFSTPDVSTNYLKQMIESFQINNPQTRFLVLGMNPAPRLNHKYFTGERFVSETEVWTVAIKRFGETYRQVLGCLNNVEFMPIAPVFNADIGYEMTTNRVSGRSDVVQSAAIDHVHPNATGYAMIADAVYHKIVHDYCQA